MTTRPDPSRPFTGRRTQSVHPLTILGNAANAKKRFARGGFVYRFGEDADPLYLVESGLVKLTLCSPSGRDLTLGLYGPGEVFGEEAVFENAERMSYAIAVDASSILVIPRSAVHRLIERDPTVSAFLMRLLATRVRDSVSQIGTLAWSPVPARLAEALLRLAGRAGVSNPAGTRVDLIITHQELANLIGSTRETTTATLNDFRRRGLIEFVRRQIVLLRPDLLSTLALRSG